VEETWQEKILRLTADKQSIEKELQQARAVTTKSAHELQGLRDQLRRADARIIALRGAIKFLRTEALVVSFTEFAKVKALLLDNEGLVAMYQGQADTAHLKGRTSVQRVDILEHELRDIDKELSKNGKVLPFPYSSLATELSAPDEEDTDDDDD